MFVAILTGKKYLLCERPQRDFCISGNMYFFSFGHCLNLNQSHTSGHVIFLPHNEGVYFDPIVPKRYYRMDDLTRLFNIDHIFMTLFLIILVTGTRAQNNKQSFPSLVRTLRIQRSTGSWMKNYQFHFHRCHSFGLYPHQFRIPKISLKILRIFY